MRLRIPALSLLLAAPTLAQGTAEYAVTFESTWSNATHPGALPGGAHYSPLIGAVHSGAVEFWAPGGLATPGMESMAETGATTLLRSEINAAIGAGTALRRLTGPGLGTPSTATITAQLDTDHSQLTLVTMIAPSPDWFVGVAGLELLEDGRWIDEVTVPLYAWDAGTDSGTAFTSSNQNTNPQEPITLQTNGPFFGTTPLATLTVQRVRATAAFGSGVNEPGTIEALGAPTLGQPLTIRCTDPQGVIPTPAITFLAVSSALQPSYLATGTGRLLPGLGLSGPNAMGELLVDVPLERVFGPDHIGLPVDHVLEMPSDPALAGLDLFVQGVYFAPSTGRIGLTDALQVVPGN